MTVELLRQTLGTTELSRREFLSKLNVLNSAVDSLQPASGAGAVNDVLVFYKNNIAYFRQSRGLEENDYDGFLRITKKLVRKVNDLSNNGVKAFAERSVRIFFSKIAFTEASAFSDEAVDILFNGTLGSEPNVTAFYNNLDPAEQASLASTFNEISGKQTDAPSLNSMRDHNRFASASDARFKNSLQMNVTDFYSDASRGVFFNTSDARINRIYKTNNFTVADLQTVLGAFDERSKPESRRTYTVEDLDAVLKKTRNVLASLDQTGFSDPVMSQAYTQILEVRAQIHIVRDLIDGSASAANVMAFAYKLEKFHNFDPAVIQLATKELLAFDAQYAEYLDIMQRARTGLTDREKSKLRDFYVLLTKQRDWQKIALHFSGLDQDDVSNVLQIIIDALEDELKTIPDVVFQHQATNVAGSPTSGGTATTGTSTTTPAANPAQKPAKTSASGKPAKVESEDGGYRESAIEIYKNLAAQNKKYKDFYGGSEIFALPSYKDIEDGKVDFEDFYMRFFNVILYFVRTTLIDKQTSSGGAAGNYTTAPVPFLALEVASGVKGLPTDANNIKFLIENFPWDHFGFEKGFGGVLWKNDWFVRFLHMQQRADVSSKVWRAGNKKEGDYGEKVISVFANEVLTDGGDFAEQSLYYTRANSKELDEKLNGTKFWNVGVLERYFRRMVNSHMIGYTDDGPAITELKNFKTYCIKNIPEELRLRHKKTNEYIDIQFIELAWDMAMWELIAKLDFFMLDTSAVFNKLAEAGIIGVGGYLHKAILGAGNTDKVWRDSMASRMERGVLPKSMFNHHYVAINEDIVDEIKFEDFIKKSGYRRLEALVKSKTQLSTEEKWRYKALKNYIEATKRRAGGESSDVDRHYLVLWVKDKHATSSAETRFPVLIPKAYVEHSEQNKLTKIDVNKRKVGGLDSTYFSKEVDLYAMSEYDITYSGLPEECILSGSIAPKHNENWANAANNVYQQIYKSLDLTDPNAVFKWMQDFSNDIKRRTTQTFLRPWLDKTFRTFALAGRGVLKTINFINDHTPALPPIPYANALKQFIWIKLPEIPELLRVFNLDKVVKGGSRYGLNEWLKGSPEITIDGQSIIGPPTSDTLSHIIRAKLEYRMGTITWIDDEINALPADQKKILTDAMHHKGYLVLFDFIKTKNKSLIKKMLNTSIDETARQMIWDLACGDEATKSGADKQLVQTVASWLFAGYIDQYRPFEDMHFNPASDLEHAYHDLVESLQTGEGNDVEPLHVGYRSLLEQMFGSIMNEIRNNSYFGKGPMRSSYDQSFITRLFIEGGITGTDAQLIADRHFETTILNKLKTASEETKGGKH